MPGQRDETVSPEFMFYLKRAVALSGDTIQVVNRRLMVNGRPAPVPRNMKFNTSRVAPAGLADPRIFPRGSESNEDNWGPVVVPKQGDVIALNPATVLSPAMGGLVLGQELARFGSELSGVGEVIRAHHERFDGTGYPDKLRSDEIPWLGRLLAVAVAYAESNHPQEVTVEVLKQGSGHKILGQQAPAGTTLTDLYTTPALTQTVASSVVVCNRGAKATTFRISLAVAGAVDAPSQYLYYDVPISKNNTFVATIGITLGATDKVRVYAGNANLTFTLLGVEAT